MTTLALNWPAIFSLPQSGASVRASSTSNSAPSLADLGFEPPHESQQQILDEAQRFNVAVCGRRYGKTELLKRLLVEPALAGRPVAYMTPTYVMAVDFYRSLEDRLARLITRRTYGHRLELSTGGVIDLWSMDNGGDRARGRKYARVGIDEAALVPGLRGYWERVVRPTLTDYAGDAWFASTPRRGGAYEEFYELGQGQQHGWMSWRLPSRLNPHLPAGEIEAARLTMSASAFAQEYEADFAESETDLVFVLDKARTIKPAPEPWGECKLRVVGIDPGGGDPTAIVPLGVARGIVGGYGEHIHQYGEFYRRGDVTVEQIAEYLSKLNAVGKINAVVVGETGGNILTNTLCRMGWPAQKADMARDEGIEHVRWLLESGRLTIGPECTNSIAEFSTYRWTMRKNTETGERFATSTSSHDHADGHDARRYAAMRILKGVGRTNAPARVEIRA